MVKICYHKKRMRATKKFDSSKNFENFDIPWIKDQPVYSDFHRKTDKSDNQIRGNKLAIKLRC